MTKGHARSLYAALTAAYAGAIFCASSLPRADVAGGSEGIQRMASNLFHVPLYSGLTYLLARSLGGGSLLERVPWRLCALVLLAAGACAALDEWHQSFVPGRSVAVSDFLLDIVGASMMLLLLRAPVRGEEDPS